MLPLRLPSLACPRSMHHRIARLTLGLLVPAAAVAQRPSVRGMLDSVHRADPALPPFTWAPIYLPSFDGAARAAGLTPLRHTRLPAGAREVRVWTQVEIGVPKKLHRFVDRGGSVSGELVYYWDAGGDEASTPAGRDGESPRTFMRYLLRGRCGDFRQVQGTGICRGRFTREPAWGEVLRAAESHGLWTLPDPETLPSDGIMVLDGWTIVVELRDGDEYRAYRYNSPEAHPKWPSAKRASEIARAMGPIDGLLARPDVERVYQGVTSGRYQSAFRPCDGSGPWELHDDLWTWVARTPTAARSALPDSAARAAGDSLVYVELVGELTPEWLAREWESKFRRALQLRELRAVHRWTGAECPQPRERIRLPGATRPRP